ncbi:hypothetical protein HBH56_198340 [Parastagonospora nodorum]|uniref:Aminoglycoside phosphotransferase domain-containing protein n=2 Tax=Phaeosphaeria nodorum (strain SN15 / ATCC MYA-4574 / FGSC 10173) TaxID=321614 RepID=A0A7U2I352_PHANO|nr:hypothetical protein SNOG_08548 [Parastagonospora nodorum SN15]KAH3906844.1 hypothetical protein HBH56_198340 [Parastagonospora nodorum]EAT83716.1 hypothetical protein SNOG_08548 [Parastagonospora nodorum SN15]KAH3924655.1 hypothetical protein HBH54_191300 [Parastagonospora nodorum]KAH3941910.1 hypothetical protein HBH53_194030 [Parastagonospora nodorum]KAH3957447.1 hypothetical protein HBH51_225150 [Parastagonospora nodorum]
MSTKPGSVNLDHPCAVDSRSQPINATAFRRYLALLSIKLLKRFRERSGNVLFLSKHKCVKYGTSVQLSEAATMQFVANHTSIPVPRIYCAFTHHKRTYIVMERICGDYVGAGWLKRSEEGKASILSQLKSMIEELRRIPPPEGTGVANVDGGPLYDVRLPGTSNQFGPFRSIADFHRHLRNNLEAHPDHSPEVTKLISEQGRHQSGPVLTHGDLSSLNVLARGDDVVGIVDWETAGWYPEYWEYTTAWNVNPQNEFWRDEVDKFLQLMPEELGMEKTRLKCFNIF